MGNYAGTRSSDGLIDTEQVGGKGRLTWDFHRSQTWTTLISSKPAIAGDEPCDARRR